MPAAGRAGCLELYPDGDRFAVQSRSMADGIWFVDTVPAALAMLDRVVGFGVNRAMGAAAVMNFMDAARSMMQVMEQA